MNQHAATLPFLAHRMTAWRWTDYYALPHAVLVVSRSVVGDEEGTHYNGECRIISRDVFLALLNAAPEEYDVSGLVCYDDAGKAVWISTQ